MCVRDRKMSGCASDRVWEAVGLRAHVRVLGMERKGQDGESMDDERMRALERRLRKRIYKMLKDQGFIEFWCEMGLMRHPRREFFEKFRQRKLFRNG